MVSIFRESIPQIIKEHLRNEKFQEKLARFEFLREAPADNKSDIHVVKDHGDIADLFEMVDANSSDNNYYIS